MVALPSRIIISSDCENCVANSNCQCSCCTSPVGTSTNSGLTSKRSIEFSIEIGFTVSRSPKTSPTSKACALAEAAGRAARYLDLSRTRPTSPTAAGAAGLAQTA